MRLLPIFTQSFYYILPVFHIHQSIYNDVCIWNCLEHSKFILYSWNVAVRHIFQASTNTFCLFNFSFRFALSFRVSLGSFKLFPILFFFFCSILFRHFPLYRVNSGWNEINKMGINFQYLYNCEHTTNKKAHFFCLQCIPSLTEYARKFATIILSVKRGIRNRRW